jgi:SAM-dependent methyltransferase
MDRPTPDHGGFTSTAAVDPNDWDRHWLDFNESVEDNPAQAFRRRIVERLLGPMGSGARVLDIGSGQGDLAAYLTRRHPAITFLGVELSSTGVTTSRSKVPSATFVQRDLCDGEDPPAAYRGWATHAVCSEVAEHVDDPVTLIRNALSYCGTGCRLVVTVPGGPMSRLDHHIGHRQHYTHLKLRSLLESAGVTVEYVGSRGFPLFNLYRLAIVARGEKLIADVDSSGGKPASLPARAAMRVFQGLLALPSPVPVMGWQIVGRGRVP